MISCQRAVEWASRERDGVLGLARRAVLGIHLLACPKCRRYRKQLVEVDRALDAFVTECVPASVRLPDEARSRLNLALREESSR